MPKKGNVKKNVSKKVKKLNNKKGGWPNPLKFFRKSEQEITITLELSKKILGSLATSQQCRELSTYIITFLKVIMEEYSFKEVTYKTSTDSTDTVNIMHNISKDDKSWQPQSIPNGRKFTFEELQPIIKVNAGPPHMQSQKHSFAIIKRVGVDHRGSEDDEIRIVFPKSLTFTFVKDIGSKILDDELGQQINEEIPGFLKGIETRLSPDGENLDFEEDLNAVRNGGKKHSKKEVLGKIMVIYKINGDRKEYVRHKGKLITVKDYKELMKAKKPTKLSKKK
jgi:hypothetical protein